MDATFLALLPVDDLAPALARLGRVAPFSPPPALSAPTRLPPIAKSREGSRTVTGRRLMRPLMIRRRYKCLIPLTRQRRPAFSRRDPPVLVSPARPWSRHPCRNTCGCGSEDTPRYGNRRRKLQPVFCKRAPTYYGDHWAGGLMAMTEAEKLSRSVMERTFYAKLGPTPGFPSSPTAQTEQGKPTK